MTGQAGRRSRLRIGTSALLVAMAALLVVRAHTLSPSAQSPRAATKHLTIERVPSSPSLLGTAPTSPAWSSDSQTLAFLWNDHAGNSRDVWTVSKSARTPTRLTGLGDEASVSEFVWLPDGSGLVFLSRGDLYQVPRAGGTPTPLTRGGGGKSTIGISPDGRVVSWLQDGDLWLRHQATGDVVQATHVGVAGTGTVPLGTYNRPDVEFGRYVWGANVPAYRWSPDSRVVALHYVDRRQVRKVPFPYYLGKETTANVLRRGYPGDHDEIRSLAFYDVTTSRLRMLEFPDQGWRHFLGFDWAPSGKLLIDQESDTQQDRWLIVADAATGAMTTVYHDERASRVLTAIESRWAGDGKHLLMVGDLEDHYRLYSVDPADGQTRALTPAAVDVTDVDVAGEGSSRSIFFVSNQKNPYERHVYRMAESGGAPVAITSMPGTHQPTVSPDGRTIAVLSSNDVTPTELYLVDAAGGAAEQRITHSPPPEFDEYAWAPARYVTFKSRIDDFTLHARIIEPPNLDRTRKYPVLFGPVYSNTVRNRWAGSYATLQQFLAVERQYIVVQVDVRGSTGYGRAFREKFLMDYGGHDLDDLQSALEYLKTVPHVDTDRAGIWGSSYGGLLTVYMLFKKPGLFKAGVAGAAAVDPHFFGTDDVALTRLPQTDPEGFRRGAASNYAAGLQDHLLFIHGMQDDVVPFKTIVTLMEQLMALGKDFDMAIAPGATHGWNQREHYAVFLFRKLVAHFDRYLGAPASGATGATGARPRD